MEKVNISTPKKGHLLKDIFLEKCPNCHNGNVYEKGTSLLKMPVMKERCDCCNYHFDREPGYFLGAMYISYGLAVFQGLLAFLTCYFLFPGLPTIFQPISIVLVILLFARKNYKLSRIIYIHLFPW